MKISSQSRGCFVPSAFSNALLVALALFCITSLTSPAFAQAARQLNLFTGSNMGPMDDSNHGNPWEGRDNYQKRFPFSKAAMQSDELRKVTSNGTNAAAGGAGRDAVTGAMGALNTAAGGQQPDPKTLEGVENTAPTPLPAYSYLSPTMAYAQMASIAQDKPLMKRDNEIFKNQMTTYGVPMSDTQYQGIHRENMQRLGELMMDPERWMWMMTNVSQLMGASASNSFAGASEGAFSAAMQDITRGPSGGGGPAGGGAPGGGAGAGAGAAGGAGIIGGGGAPVGALINIANENAGVPTASNNPWKTIPQAVWMVQVMFRECYIPMAILLLLPGAVISQVKVQIQGGFNLRTNGTVINPFEGILRSIIAIFLIPATQLIVSYSIDTGNSMAYSVKDWVSIPTITDWTRNLSYNIKPGNEKNAILPAEGEGSGAGVPGADASWFDWLDFGFGFGTGDGLGINENENEAHTEQQLWLSQTLELMFNMAMYLFSMAVIILGSYQLVMMCYLYLMGPIAAALFAWPEVGQRLFRNIWGKWLEAVISVALWRFYWMVILAVMTQRILYVMGSGGMWDMQWEVAVFTCLLGLMLYAPFHPFEFEPSEAYAAAKQGGQLMGGSPGQQGQGGISGAMGQAAIQGGANPEQVRAMQAQVGKVTDGIAGIGDSPRQMENRMSSGVSAAPGSAGNVFMPSSSGPPPGQQPIGPQSNAAPISGAPPNMAGAPPPGESVSTASASMPPGAEQSNPNLAAAQASMPLTQVASLESQPTPSLEPPAGATATAPVALVNPNVGEGDIAPSVESQGGTPASSGAPPPGNGGEGGAPSVSSTTSSATQIASAGDPSRGSEPSGGSGQQSPDTPPPPSSIA